MVDEVEDQDVDEDYEGPERRVADDETRRVRLDPRKGVRFDTTGGDRRSGFARRNDDEGLHDADFED